MAPSRTRATARPSSRGWRTTLRAFRHVPDLAARVSESVRRAAHAQMEPPAAAAAVANSQQPPMVAATEEKGETFMNISELREQHPDLVAEIEARCRQG